MHKPTKKSIKFNEDVLSVLRARYGYSLNYIRKSLRGDRVGIMPDTLIKEYKALVKADEAIQAAAKKQLQEKANNLNK